MKHYFLLILNTLFLALIPSVQELMRFSLWYSLNLCYHFLFNDISIFKFYSPNSFFLYRERKKSHFVKPCKHMESFDQSKNPWHLFTVLAVSYTDTCICIQFIMEEYVLMFIWMVCDEYTVYVICCRWNFFDYTFLYRVISKSVWYGFIMICVFNVETNKLIWLRHQMSIWDE